MKSKQKLFLYSVVAVLFFLYIVTFPQITNTEASVSGWGLNTTRDTSQYVLNTNLSAHIFPEHFCDHDSFLLVVVCSAPINLDARNAIRETWGHDKKVFGYNVSLYFLLGETLNSSLQNDLEVESSRYGDIIEERFVDSYNNLTLKSVVMLKLVSSFCANATKYLLKIDDDMFVNMQHIVKMLAERNGTTDLLIGSLICWARPIKDSTSKWYSPNYMYPEKMYPNYLSGTGYVMSLDVTEKLYRAALKTPIFHLEDVYITGLCAREARVRPRSHPLFTYHKLNYDLCLFMRLYTAHRFTPTDIRRTYALLRDGNVTKECATKKNESNVKHWLLKNILKVNKSYRKPKCE